MIYSSRAQPGVNKSHILEVPQNNWLIFHMGEVSHGQGINRDTILFVVLTQVHLQNKQTSSFPCIYLTIEQQLRKNAVGFTIVKQHNSCIYCLQTLMSNFFVIQICLPTKTTIYILKKLYNTFKIGKIALGFGHCQKILAALQLLHFFSHCTARMAETSDSEEELFLRQSIFEGS